MKTISGWLVGLGLGLGVVCSGNPVEAHGWRHGPSITFGIPLPPPPPVIVFESQPVYHPQYVHHRGCGYRRCYQRCRTHRYAKYDRCGRRVYVTVRRCR